MMLLGLFLTAVCIVDVALVVAILFTAVRAYRARLIMKSQLVGAIVLVTVLFVAPLIFILLFHSSAAVTPAPPGVESPARAQ